MRVPEWGRTFESYGEDPYFNGQMAQAEIKGIQSQGPIANANMYLTMHQESNRFKEDSIVDERTLHEIYLVPFAAAVERGHVGDGDVRVREDQRRLLVRERRCARRHAAQRTALRWFCHE